MPTQTSIKNLSRRACLAWLGSSLLPVQAQLSSRVLADGTTQVELRSHEDRPLQPVWRSSFLVNLHHWLLDLATRRQALERTQWQQEPDPAQRALIEQGQGFYRQRFKDLEVMDDEPLQWLAQLCSVDDGERSAAGLKLEPALLQTLQQLAPVYAQCLWPRHQRANAAWVTALEPLLKQHGGALQRKLSLSLNHGFPESPWRVDLVAQSGDFRGAYTPDGPLHTVMPSERSDYQGPAALEMLFHEASHLGVIDTVFERIKQLRAAQGLDAPDGGLWHALQFYTVGELTRAELARAGLDYQPYALRNRLFERGPWAGWMPRLQQHWQPWLDGRTEMDAALGALVKAFA